MRRMSTATISRALGCVLLMSMVAGCQAQDVTCIRARIREKVLELHIHDPIAVSSEILEDAKAYCGPAGR